MIKVGILGFNFMGKMHFRCYKAMKNVRVSAICDRDSAKLSGAKGAAGNISGTEEPLDMKGIELYTDADKMLAEGGLDAVSITLPTYLHRDFTIKALKAGVNVFCEKPMALNVADCKKMIEAAAKYKKHLQVGHCIRFWPEYAKAKELVDSGEYGKVLAATFQRLSMTPDWSWKGWLLEGRKSGGAAFDLHIHDSDFIQYLFGMPRRVFSRGAKGFSRDIDHIMTNYIYGDNKVVTAEGGWLMTPGFGFEMNFNIVFEKAVLSYNCNKQPALKLAPAAGRTFSPKVEKGDGYFLELKHWVKTLQGQKVPAIITPKASLDSVKLALAEKRSCATGKTIMIK